MTLRSIDIYLCFIGCLLFRLIIKDNFMYLLSSAAIGLFIGYLRSQH